MSITVVVEHEDIIKHVPDICLHKDLHNLTLDQAYTVASLMAIAHKDGFELGKQA